MLNNEEILKFINEDKTSKKKRNAEIGQDIMKQNMTF